MWTNCNPRQCILFFEQSQSRWSRLCLKPSYNPRTTLIENKFGALIFKKIPFNKYEEFNFKLIYSILPNKTNLTKWNLSNSCTFVVALYVMGMMTFAFLQVLEIPFLEIPFLEQHWLPNDSQFNHQWNHAMTYRYMNCVILVVIDQ